MLKTFITDLVSMLKLKHPVNIMLVIKENEHYDGYYLAKHNDKGKLCGHRIRIYLNEDTARTLEATIAHELIHAWQEENNDKAMHGKRFARRARRIEQEYGILNIYIPRVDT